MENPLKLFEPSNVMTEILASVGIVGCVAFLCILFCYLRTAKQVLQAQETSPEKKHWTFLFLISALVLLVVLQFNQGLLRTYTWTHLALTFALMVKKESFTTQAEREMSVPGP